MEYVFDLPDLKGLATLKEVVERGGLEEAGRGLHIGQPAVTKRLRALEACYRTPLMQRQGRRLELTQAGDRVYRYARLVLDHQRFLLDDLEALRSGTDNLRLDVNFAIGEHLLSDLLLRFAERHPDFRINSRMGYTRDIQTRLATGLSDLALLEQAPDHPDILVQKWLDDEILLVCGGGHPLYDRPEIALDELAGLLFVLREPQSSVRLLLDKALRDAGAPRLSIAMEVGSADTIKEMLERGRHVSFLPRFAVSDTLTSGVLRHIPIRGLRLRRTLWIARTRANLNNRVAEAFIQLLRI